MGNKCPACSCAKEDGCLEGLRKNWHRKSEQAGNVIPEDLHASGRKGTGSAAGSTLSQRPVSLDVHPVSQEVNPRFPTFPLHGVAKSSPTATCGSSSPASANTPQAINLKKIEQLFESYRDVSQDDDAILAEGVEKFCLDLEVDPADFVVLALAWKFKAKTMCRFSRKEFTDGFVALQCDSVTSLRSSFKRIESDALENFKELYRYTFQFALDAEQGQRSLPCNIATAMWNVVFSKKRPALLDPWFKYIQDSKVRGISRDTWNMFLYLTESLNEDFSNYNDSEAWPSLFDDFVDYQRELQRSKAIKEKENEEHGASPESLLNSDETGETPSHSEEARTLTSEQTSENKLVIPGAITSSEGSTPEQVDSELSIAHLQVAQHVGDHLKDVNQKQEETGSTEKETSNG